jgi:hypothetical protein
MAPCFVMAMLLMPTPPAAETAKSACISMSIRRNASSNAPDPEGREIVMEVMFAFVLIVLVLVGALPLAMLLAPLGH